jgi:3-oxoacyl-[acyl-carrier protein] reductase
MTGPPGGPSQDLMTHQPTAIVTGASRGIGRGIALALGREGFNVVINYASNADAAREVQQQIESMGSKAAIVQADVSKVADRQKLVDETVKAFGRIDLLVNNAGVAPNVRADLLEAGEESFDRLININLKGPYFLTQLVARQMIQQAAGSGQQAARIVTVSSISAYTASINRGDYCVAKAGLSMMTQLFAARLAEHGIGVYEIRPGIIETDMTGPVKAKYDKLILEDGLTPIRRWGKPDDIAAAVLAIAKGAFPFSTGEVFNIDGGFHMRTL